MKIKILPLINVVPSQDTVLADERARNNAIANIIRVVKENQYDGANIDFEFIPTTAHKDFSVDRGKMTLFMQIVNSELKKNKKITHMAVLPRVNVPVEMTGVYDYGALAKFVSKVTIMCYDFRQEGSPPGPIAPFEWVEKNITTAINQGFKPSQICLGVATYGYDWPVGRSGGVSRPSREILKNASVRGYQVKWSKEYQEPFYVYWTLRVSKGKSGSKIMPPYKQKSIWPKSINFPGFVSGGWVLRIRNFGKPLKRTGEKNSDDWIYLGKGVMCDLPSQEKKAVLKETAFFITLNP